MKNKITKWWDLTTNFNLFTSKINIDDPAVPEQDQFLSWFGKMNNSFKLPKNFSFHYREYINLKRYFLRVVVAVVVAWEAEV